MNQIEGGDRYLLEGQADIDATFECVATVGISGHRWERPVSAAVEALDPALNAPDGCNAGFSRDDAILVITIVSDDNVNAIVMLGIFRGNNGNPISPPVKFHDFVGLFGFQGRLHTTDSSDYSPSFIDAVGLIDLTCDEFNPEG